MENILYQTPAALVLILSILSGWIIIILASWVFRFVYTVSAWNVKEQSAWFRRTFLRKKDSRVYTYQKMMEVARQFALQTGGYKLRKDILEAAHLGRDEYVTISGNIARIFVDYLFDYDAAASSGESADNMLMEKEPEDAGSSSDNHDHPGG